jgi:hypothetical protein
MLRIDHVIVAVRDLDEADRWMLDRYGLASVPGGRHQGWGTGNRIVPLGSGYVELIAVVDAAEAPGSSLGRRVASAVGDEPRLMGWCVSTSDVEGVANRLGLAVGRGSRRLPDGSELRWRSAGLDVAIRRPFLPFFISWEVPAALHPEHATASHRIQPRGIAWIEVRGDAPGLQRWLQEDEELPVRCLAGSPEDVVRVGIGTAEGDLMLGPGDPAG